MKKAQIEIVGLLIIVILISIVLFFGVVFLLDQSETQTPPEQEFGDIQLLSNFGPVFMDASTGCIEAGRRELIVQDLLSRCIRIDVDYTCEEMNGKDACEALNETLVNIKNETFDEFGLVSHVILQESNDGKLISDLDTSYGNVNCSDYTGDSYREAMPIPVRDHDNDALLDIKICN